MKYSFKSFVALLSLATMVFGEGTEGEVPSDVKQLTKDTFDAFVAEHPLLLAEFYAPWCGHCKALAPEYEDAATKLKEKNIPLAKIDCTEEADLCQKFEVQGYPTVKVFRGLENHKAYSGPRKSDAIVSYMTKQSLPAVSKLDVSSHADFKKADKVVVIAYLDEDDKTSTDVFNGVADTLRDDYLFGVTTDATLAKAEGVKTPAVVLYKSFDEGKVVFDGKLDAEEITKFTKTAATPLIGEVGPDTYQGYMSAGLPLAYLFFDSPESKETLSKQVRPLAEKFKGKINFATIDAVAFGAHAPNLNLEAKWPAFAIQETTKNSKYPFPQDKELTEEAIAKFVEDYAEGKISPSIKSEPIPETQEGPVTVVVAHNYQDVIINNEKDVLVEFYAPWCGHCKALAPKYDELANLYKDLGDKVVVAKVDATANDVPDEIQGFPTIKLFPAGSKASPVEYAGSRTVEDLANFIKENGKWKVDAYKGAAEEETVAEKVAEKVEEVKEKVEEAAEAVSEKVSEKVADATEKVAEATESAKAGHDEL